MTTYNYTEDDYCDIFENKICDNCGKCLEAEGVDTKAIKIEDIAKTVEENKVLEEEFKKELEAQEAALDKIDSVEEFERLQKEYEKLGMSSRDDDYEDAFDHIEYIEELDIMDDEILETMTEEIFPGVRRIVHKEK